MTGCLTCSKSSWLNLVFQLVEFVKLVLILVEFCAKLVEFSSSESRRRVCSRRSLLSMVWFLK